MSGRGTDLSTSRARTGRLRVIRVIGDLVLPVALYYLLRAAGVSPYVTLLASALIPAVGTVYQLVRKSTVDGLAVYILTMLVISTAVSLIAGSPRFLLARDCLLTGLTGLWFLASAWTRRPLTYLYTRPMLERRFGPAGIPWDILWEHLPRFRRLWRVSSVLWGIGLLVDSIIRVEMAYRLPVDEVPGLGTLLYVVTSVVLIIVTNICYIVGGLYQPKSALFAPLRSDATAGSTAPGPARQRTPKDVGSSS